MATVFDDIPESGTVFDDAETVFDALPNAPEADAGETNSFMRTAAATGARIVPAVGGAVLGSLAGPVGTVVGGAGGGMLGEYLAQMIEGKGSGGQIALAGALGAIPGIPIAKGIGTVGRVAIRGLEGALMGGGGQVGSNVVEGKPLMENVPTAALVGAPLGLAGGLAERALMRPAAQAPFVGPPTPAPEMTPVMHPAPVIGPPTMQQRIAQLQAEHDRLSRGKDPIAPLSTSPILTDKEMKKLHYLRRSSPEQALNYMQELLYQKQVPQRTVELGSKMLGVPAERGAISRFLGGYASDALVPHQPSTMGLFLRKLGQESSKMVDSFGPAGKALTGMVRQVYDRFETQLSNYLDGPQGVGHLALKLNLTKLERENIFDVMEGIAAPLNGRVNQVAQVMRSQREAISQRATGVFEIRDPKTGLTIPWQPRPNYMPHFVDFDQVAADPARLAKVVGEIQAQQSHNTGKVVTIQEAQDLFNQLRRNSRQEYGHLEVARTFDFSDYERDGIKAWSRYVEGSLKRFNEAEVFGKKSENIVNAYNQIGLQAGDDAAQAVQTYMTRVMGKDPITGIRSVDGNAAKVLNVARSLQTGLKLGQAVIANMSQSNMTGLIVGYGNLAKGLKALHAEGGRDFARLAGATFEQTMRDLVEATGPGKFGTSVLKYTGFSKVEQFNRMLAANAGKVFAMDLAEKLRTATGRAADTYKQHLRKMGIEPMDVIQRGFKLTKDEELSAARSIISRSQFKVRPQDLPLYWSGPLGKFVTQFSSFGFKAAKAINDEVIHQARAGNFTPLARYLLITPLVGEVFADVQSLMKNKERPENILARVADNYASIGALGIFWDAFRSTGYGEVGVLRRMAGPSLSDAAQVVAGMRDPKMLAKLATQNIPVVGPYLRPTLFPPKRQTGDD